MKKIKLKNDVLLNTRIRKGYNQIQLAEAAGISNRSICAFESGASTPSIITAEKLLNALELEFDDLFDYR